MDLDTLIKTIGVRNTIALARCLKAIRNVLTDKTFIEILKALSKK